MKLFDDIIVVPNAKCDIHYNRFDLIDISNTEYIYNILFEKELWEIIEYIKGFNK